MSHFRPARASPPARPITATPTARSIDVPSSSTLLVPELTNLSPEDVSLLDAIIQRAGPNATTFLTVFKAYSDILQERGLDSHEVQYYGKLLKLGTLKGRNWGDKWHMVKLHNGYTDDHAISKSTFTPQERISSVLRLPILDRVLRTDEESLFSVQGESSIPPSGGASSTVDVPQYHNTPHVIREFRSTSPSGLTSTDIDDPVQYPILAPPTRSRLPVYRNQVRGWSSGISDETRAPSTTPPSYRAATRDTPKQPTQPEFPHRHLRTKQDEHLFGTPGAHHDRIAAARKAIAQAKERRGSDINEQDAWRKIEMHRDEEEADRFRQEKLLERCWDVWKQGYQWIIITNEQISQARDNVTLRVCFQRWRSRMAVKHELYDQISTLSNKRCLRSAFNTWKIKLRERRQAKWRQGMRLKMKIVRVQREAKLRKDAWAKWRQSYRSHLSGQHYMERLVLKFYKCWKEGLVQIEQLEATADEAELQLSFRRAEGYWRRWKHFVEVRTTERRVQERVGLRIMGESMWVWKKRLQENRTADGYHDLIVMKNAICSWKAARDRIRILENRADKHLVRQDDVLLRAVARVWKARERGRLLERVKSVRLLKSVWSVWKRRLQQEQDQKDTAIRFSQRKTSYDCRNALNKWRQAYITHNNAYKFAIQYHHAQLQYKMMFTWRVKLRDQLRLMKHARSVEKALCLHRFWRLWQERFADRKREKRLQVLEKGKLRKYFNVWLQHAQSKRQIRIAVEIMEFRVSKRIMEAALARWTNRVIEVKLRELETTQRYELVLQRSAFKKWKNICVRHVEELSLMESYHYVKREENLRRMFHRWLTAARTSRHRRLTLHKREDAMKIATISVAWDKWIGRFKDAQLRPIEHAVVLQCQRNLLFRTFGIWHAKTKSLPAIRFHASRLKAKHWSIWRNAMPRAMLSKTAREFDKRAVLSKFLDKWAQVYRTKMALKAVARARYLRLPTTTPRQGPKSSRPATSPTPRPIFPRRPVPSEVDEDEASNAGPSQPIMQRRPFSNKTGLVTLLSLETRSETGGPVSSKPFITKTRESSPTRSKASFGGFRQLRDTSPARPPSSAGGDEGRSKLWLELQEIKRRSRPSSIQSAPREPP